MFFFPSFSCGWNVSWSVAWVIGWGPGRLYWRDEVVVYFMSEYQKIQKEISMVKMVNLLLPKLNCSALIQDHSLGHN